jgi:hypothetical protein
MVSKSAVVRHSAFRRHAHPFSAETEALVDDIDEGADTVVFMARCKQTGEALGSARVTECNDISVLLSAEERIPEMYHDRDALLFSRLAVVSGARGRLVRAAIGKAAFLYSIARQSELTFAFVAPPRERLYYRDGFKNMMPNDILCNFRANSGISSRILFIDNWKYEKLLSEINRPLHSFIFSDRHPDILVFESISGSTRVRRRSDVQSRVSTLPFQQLPGLPV